MSKEKGNIRSRKSFLLFPKTIDNETRWLEYAEWEEEYVIDGLAIKTATFIGWRSIRWLN